MYPNGGGRGKDSHVSLFLELLPGHNDDQLEWPYALPYQLSVVNQVGGRNAKIMIDPDGDTECWGKPMDKPNLGYGESCFLKHTDVASYLLNHEMVINIKILQKGQSDC